VHVCVGGGRYVCHIVNCMLFVCAVGVCVEVGWALVCGGWVSDFFYVGVMGRCVTV
jgi:hypothetical protein